MFNFNIIVEAVAKTADNTFAGTLAAGLIIAYSGLWLYQKQKKLDIEFSKKDRLHDLTVSLLTNINVAVKDYIGQISVHDGSNPVTKAIFDKLESRSPGFYAKGISKRFHKYVINITQSLNDLSTPLALNPKNEQKVKALAETIPLMNFLLSAASTFPNLPASTLKDVSEQMIKNYDEARDILEEIIKE